MSSLFISHASEDKAAIARPLAQLLQARGYKVWYDEYTLTLGDSLRREIDVGLAQCDFGVVLLSPNFFAKEWPQKELDALFAREMADRQKRILPIWHELDAAVVARSSPILASRLAVSTSRGLRAVVDEIERAVAGVQKQGHTAPRSATAEPWAIRVIAPSLSVGGDGKNGLLIRAKATFVNRSARAAVLSFRMRYELEPNDSRRWVAIPEGPKQENECVRVEAEGFAVRDLFFHFIDTSQYGGNDFIRGRGARLWITDHVQGQQALLEVPTPI